MTINDHQDENPIKHDWRTDYSNRPYYGDIQRELPDVDYDRDLRSAYELGQHARNERGTDARFEDSESDLKVKWEELKAESRLKWEQAKHAIKDAETVQRLDDTNSVGKLVKLIKDKPLMTISNMLVSQEEIDFISAYDAKEALYKAQSYLMGYKLGYTDVTLTYPELKDLELLLSLYENDDLFDLIEKYSDI